MESSQDDGVGADRDEDHETVDGLEPELRQSDKDQRVGDEPEEQGAECCPGEGPRAAKDADPANDDRGDDLRTSR